VPFGFGKRKGDAGGEGRPATPPASVGDLRAGPPRGVRFTAITEDWRLTGRMDIPGRLSDALNRREAISIDDVQWGPPDGSAGLEPAPGLKSLDPYDLILITAGEESLPPLTEAERAAIKVHKVPYDVAFEVPPFRVVGTVYLHPGAEPERLLERSTDMFLAVVDAVATLDGVQVNDPDVEVILVNRSYLRAVAQVDRRTGEVAAQLPGATNATTMG
jgi:hypothetical protein